MEHKVKLLFWNLKNNKNDSWVTDIIQENEIDIAIFAEYHKTSFERVISNLKNTYFRCDGFGACEKITLLSKENINTIVRREQNRYTLYSCSKDNHIYNVVGIHLPASPSSSSNDRKNVIRAIVHDICEQEKELKNRLTIVLGDFNCNPFDEEIIQKDAFNAVLYKELIMKQEIVTYQNQQYRRFYNPILHYLSESTQTYGSFYYSSSIIALYWNSFDQILVRKDLAEKIKSFEYIRSIKGKKLLNDIKPNSTISDHLPLIVNIEEV